MKAQTFKIVGDKYLLEAIVKSLKDFGYTISNSEVNLKCVSTNVSSAMEEVSLERFKEIYLTNFEAGGKHEIFTLPEDYKKALEFAKAQLAPEMWQEPIKEGDIVASLYSGIFVEKVGTLGVVSFKDKRFYVHSKTGEELSYSPEKHISTLWRKATPEEIDEFNRIDWKVGELCVWDNLVGKILIRNITRPQIQLRNGKLIYVDIAGLIKPTPEQIEEFNKPVFKIGDYIVLTRDWPITKAGTMGIYRGLHKGCDKLIDFEYLGGSTGIAELVDFRLATKEEIVEATKPVYKAGDTVYIISDEQGGATFIGEMFILQDKWANQYYGNDTWNMGNSRISKTGYSTKVFRHATPEEIKKANEPKDGDIVFCIDTMVKNYYGKIGKLKYNEGDWKYVVEGKNERIWQTNVPTIHEYFRKATKEEIEGFNKVEPKLGDILVNTSGYVFKVDCITNTHYQGKQKNGNPGGAMKDLGFTYATPTQVEEFNKKDYVEMIVGSKNAKIKVYKTYIEVRGEVIHTPTLEEAYFHYMDSYCIGAWNLTIADPVVRFLLVGCIPEDNRISLKELKKILETAEKL